MSPVRRIFLLVVGCYQLSDSTICGNPGWPQYTMERNPGAPDSTIRKSIVPNSAEIGGVLDTTFGGSRVIIFDF